MDLTDYLMRRGLDLEPHNIDKDPVLENEALLEELSDVWREHKGAIQALVQSRVNAIGDEMLKRALPVEIPVLRQALVEVAEILVDWEKYHGEHLRRSKGRTNDIEPEPAPEPAPEEGEESSL